MTLKTDNDDSFHEAVISYKKSCAKLHISYRAVIKELKSILLRIVVIKKKLSTEQRPCDQVLRYFESIEHNLKTVKGLMEDIPEYIKR